MHTKSRLVVTINIAGINPPTIQTYQTYPTSTGSLSCQEGKQLWINMVHYYWVNNIWIYGMMILQMTIIYCFERLIHYLTPTMSLSYRPKPNKGGMEKVMEKSQISWSILVFLHEKSLFSSQIVFSLFITIRRILEKITVLNNETIP